MDRQRERERELKGRWVKVLSVTFAPNISYSSTHFFHSLHSFPPLFCSKWWWWWRWLNRRGSWEWEMRWATDESSVTSWKSLKREEKKGGEWNEEERNDKFSIITLSTRYYQPSDFFHFLLIKSIIMMIPADGFCVEGDKKRGKIREWGKYVKRLLLLFRPFHVNEGRKKWIDCGCDDEDNGMMMMIRLCDRIDGTDKNVSSCFCVTKSKRSKVGYIVYVNCSVAWVTLTSYPLSLWIDYS